MQGALSNYGYRWGWFAIGCIFQVLIVAGLLLTGAARQASSAVHFSCLGTRGRELAVGKGVAVVSVKRERPKMSRRVLGKQARDNMRFRVRGLGVFC